MKQSLLAAMPETRTTFGIPRSDSPQDALRRLHVNHCLEVLDDHIKGTMNYVVYAGKKPAGMVSLSPLKGTKGVWIDGVFGLPGTKGVGVHAIRAAIELSLKSEGRGRVELNLLPNNADTLRKFYGRAGFEENSFYNDKGEWEARMYLTPQKAREFLRATEGNSPRFVT